MSFIQLTINTDAETADNLSDAFIELGALSISIEDQFAGTDAEEPIFGEPDGAANFNITLWNYAKLTILFSETVNINDIILDVTNQLGYQFEYATQKIADQDWVKLTQDQFKPIEITDNFYIVPSWHLPPKKDAMSITLDPGLAFGTGSHPTTFMCLEWIANNITPAITNILDYGCGSGILAISCKKFGAKKVYGVDIDPQAIIASKNNGLNNKVDINFSLPHELPHIKFDIVIANILSNPLRILAPNLAQLTKNTLILSGILDHQAQELSNIYSEWFDVETINTIDGWVLLKGSKR